MSGTVATPTAVRAWAPTSLGGAAWVATGLLGLSAVDGTGGYYVTEVSWLAVHALVLVGIVGLLRSGWTGDLRWGRRALQLAAIASVLFFGFEVAAIVQGTDELAFFPIAVVGTGVGMLVGGLAIIRAGHRRGWGRFAPAAVGAYPFLVIVPVFAATGHRPPDVLVAGWGLTLLLVGAALATLPSTSPRSSATIPTALLPLPDGPAYDY